MAKGKKVPELRFKGFEEEWGTHTLGEFGATRSGIGFPENEQGGRFGIPFFKVSDMNIVGNENAMTNANNYVSGEQVARRKWKPISQVPAVVFAKVGAAVLLNRKRMVSSPFLIDNNLMAYVFDSSWTISFGKAFFENINLPFYAQTGALPSYKGRDIEDIPVILPLDGEEQTQIGSFFQDLDSLIDQHQRKHDKLIANKKALLEKMFPREGTAVPELRFKGFTGKWESKTSGDLYTERNEPGNADLAMLSVSIHTGVSDGELDSEALGKQVRRSEDKSKYKRLCRGDLIFNMMRAWQGAIGVANADGMVSPAYITAIPSKEVFPQFMDWYMSRDQMVLQMNNLSYGVTDFRKRLYWDSFVTIQCSLPSVQEQEKIAAFFQHLDSLISLHARELDKLKTIKKACLEKMFV